MELRDACRLCLSTQEEAVSIFECSEEGTSFSHMIEELFSIKLLKTPNHTSQACLCCIRKVKEAKKFKEGIIVSQMKLFEQEKRLRGKIEPVKPMDLLELSMKTESLDNENDLELPGHQDVSSTESPEDPDLDQLEEELRRRNLLVCKECDEVSPSFDSHMHHFAEVHSRKGFISCCNENFRGSGVLDHMKFHLDTDAFKCTTCEEKLLSRRKLYYHVHNSCAGPGLQVTTQPDQEGLDKELEKRNLLACQICEAPTESYKELMMHMKSAHDKNGFAICCNKKFIHQNLLEHMRYHLNDETYKCNSCDKILGSAELLRLHKLTCVAIDKKRLENNKELEEEMRKRNLLVCPVCTWSEVESFQQLMDHMKDVHQETGYILCCNVEFDSATVFQHIQFHLDEDLFKCKECGRRMTSKIELDAHFRRRHSKKNRKLFSCETCGKKLKSLANLQDHYKTHSAQRELTFICEVCGRGFDLKRLLVVHSYSHREKKTEQCTICGKHYFRLKVHMDMQHSVKKKDKCEICGFETTQLKLHMTSKHVERKFHCKDGSCQKVFKTARNLKKHMIMHEGLRIKCVYCEKPLSHAHVTAHIRVKHPESFAEYKARKYSTPRTLKYN